MCELGFTAFLRLVHTSTPLSATIGEPMLSARLREGGEFPDGLLETVLKVTSGPIV